jgi:hypothetical protein
MEKMRLALDIDNYPELIILANNHQEEISAGGGKRAHTGRAQALIGEEDFRNLLDVTAEIRLINLKTNKTISNATVFIDEATLDIIYCVPKRVYTKRHGKPRVDLYEPHKKK